jgi:hypothetical protein
LLRQNRLFWIFAAVVKSPNCRFFAKGAFEIDEFAAFFANCDRRECPWYEHRQQVGAIGSYCDRRECFSAHLPLTTLPPILPFVVANFRQLAFVVFVANHY